jgi:hypothetical protein
VSLEAVRQMMAAPEVILQLVASARLSIASVEAFFTAPKMLFTVQINSFNTPVKTKAQKSIENEAVVQV